jgi:antitoxin (DNA-binding transcriptional repressor) of toxin-antitoxin stability system
MTAIPLNEAQAKLADLIHGLTPGECLVITENDLPIAQLTPAQTVSPTRKLGSMRGTVTYMAPDFDAPLEDFREYMQ